MEKILKILILVGSSADAVTIQQLLKKEKIACAFSLPVNKETFLQALDKFLPDIVLSDNSLPQFGALEAMKITRQKSLEIPFILVTETISEEFAANIIKAGADDYILKEKMTILPMSIQAALKKRKIDEELRKSHERFQYITQASLDIIWELNFETKQYMLHEGREKIFGLNSTVDWKIGIEGKYILEADREIVRQSFKEARLDESRTLWEKEYRVYSRDNSIMHVINHAKFIRDENGKAVRVIGAITDITERKRLEHELVEHHRNEQLKVTAIALEAQEKERNIIGQELHDNVNQILVGAKLLLSMVDNNNKKNEDLVKSVLNSLENAIEENRKLSHRLVTPDLELDTLSRQLYNLAHDMLAASGIKIKVSTSMFREELLTNDQKVAIYRIAQEQCTNIIKYAQAKNVTISLTTVNKLFTMIIADDGRGMNHHKASKGIGLRNISARASVFQGKACVKSNPGEGFTLQIKMPVTV